MTEVLRGQVYLALHPDLEEKKYFLVVSNNKRNKALGSALCLRITTTDKRNIPTCVALPKSKEGLTGFIVCDDVYLFYTDELGSPVTAVTDAIMRDVESALKLVFSIRS
ncbi:MAG: hypothetical protein RIS08_485 [Actinomycetota bacterium]